MSGQIAQNRAGCEAELARLAAGAMRTDEVLDVSRRVMRLAAPTTSQWSQAAAHHGWGLFVQGRVTEALKLIEQAWLRADALDDPVAGGIAAQLGGTCCASVYDYRQAEAWYVRELDRARSRIVGTLRYSLIDLLASARVSHGNIDGARAALGEFDGAIDANPLLAYHDGDWERAIAILRERLEASRAASNGFGVAVFASLLGRLERIANQRIEAETYLKEALAASLDWQDLKSELFTRAELALLNVDLCRIGQANENLKRCQQILELGDDWRGHKGTVAYVSAVISATEYISKATGQSSADQASPLRLPDEVAKGFRSAIETFRRYHAPWEESAAQLLWSRMLFAAGSHREAADKLNSVFAIFDAIGAKPDWSERIQATMSRFLALDGSSAANGDAPTAQDRPATIEEAARNANIFRKEGDYWTISFEGAVIRLRDTAGMHYIGRLITNPGRSFSAQDLAQAARKATAGRSTRKARSGHEVPKANDDRALERARLMVTKRIKHVIAKIRLTHPGLARHFATSIRTGYSCAYRPDRPRSNAWLT